jgi:antitoxin (DNA-binding transcriptional repressor) of toxin-antitoxin stability system
MAFYIHASVYEVKANLSAFIRAINCGFTDYVVIERYGRKVARLLPLNWSEEPALTPQTKSDLAMWRRAVFREDGGRPSRRG